MLCRATSERTERGIAAPFESEESCLLANGLNTPRRLGTLAELLFDRGHSETRVERILGGDLLRAFAEAWP